MQSRSPCFCLQTKKQRQISRTSMKQKRNEKSHAENKMKWMSRVRLNDFLLITRKKNHFNVVLMIDMARLKRWRRRWSLDENVCISLSNLFHDKWLFLIDLALCLIITRCTIENFPLLLLLLWELFFFYALRY